MADLTWLLDYCNGMSAYDYVVTHYVKHKTCDNCELCFHHNGVFVCAGRSDLYGKNVNEIMGLHLADNCLDWELSFEKFQKLCRSLDKGRTPRKI